ncbi:MAG: BMP family ABC transporter substrate-binding protein, partial [Thermodesulfobacteriota bacterium]|nr:BMP family ABC transporter substrate-binding protein [Thermodesulfobacteriota bacterium]
FAPNSFLTAPIWNWAALYTKLAEEVHNGTWESEQIWWGMKEGLVKLAEFSSKVPAAVQVLVTEKGNAIKTGLFHPFVGPIKDQNGQVVVAAGKIPSDGELLGMNYFVEGVQGTISK